MTDIEMKEHIQYWKLQEISSVVDEFDSCICDKTDELQLKLTHDYRTILFFMAGKTVITMKEVICLVQFGYPDGALSLARNLYEQFVVVSFFENHKQDPDFQDYIDDFFDDYEIQRNRLLKFEAEFVQMDAVVKQKIEQGINRIRTLAHHKGKGDYWWAGKNSFRDLAEEMIDRQSTSDYKKFVALNHMMYMRACTSLHVSCAGNILRIGDAADFVGVDNRQRENGYELPLLLTVGSFLYVVGVVCEEFGLDGADWNVRLNDLLIYYNTFLEDK